MKPFTHITPKSLPEAISLLAQENGQGQVIAGGTDFAIKNESGCLRSGDYH